MRFRMNTWVKKAVCSSGLFATTGGALKGGETIPRFYIEG